MSKANEEPMPDTNPQWKQMNEMWCIGGLRELNRLINAANEVGANVVTLEKLIERRNKLDEEIREYL